MAKQHGDVISASNTEDVDMEDERGELQAPPVEDMLPAAWLENKTYRLTRDWRKWPSAGVLQHEVSNLQQAQYGVTADLMFETMKVRR